MTIGVETHIFDAIKNLDNVFITGPGGCGKSFLIKKLYRRFREENKFVGLTATTGTAAVMIGGSTIHSFLGIGLAKESAYSIATKLRKKPYHLKIWRDLKALIIDEVSMLSVDLFLKLNAIAKLLRNTDVLFGGIQLVLTGDFLQLPSVEKENVTLFDSDIWKDVVTKTFYLDKIYRQSDSNFIEMLEKIRMGECSDEHEELLLARKHAVIPKDVFPTQLFSLNRKVESFNNKHLDRVSKDKEIFEYHFEATFNVKHEHKVYTVTTDNVEELCSTNPTIYALYTKYISNLQFPEILRVCIGCHVMLLTNNKIEIGLANGSQGIVEGFNEDGYPVVKFYNGKTSVIEPHTWEFEETDLKKERDVKLGEVTQIPLRLSFAMSIHKSQGATMDYVSIDFEKMFEYGQAYVALSRCKSLEGLVISNFEKEKIKAHPRAIEYYKTLLATK